MSTFDIFVLCENAFAAGACSLFWLMSSKYKTSPTTVCLILSIAFFIWFVQINYNGYLAWGQVPISHISKVLNKGIFNTLKLLLFVGASTIMYYKYMLRER